MIRQLENPLTDSYKEFKELCLGKETPWSWHDYHIEGVEFDPTERSNFGFYGFAILQREENREKVPTSQLGSGKLIEIYLRKSIRVFSEIVRHNNIQYNKIHRISLNATHAVPPPKLGVTHLDHYFPHKNFIIYLTDCFNGPTVCQEEKFYGKEDDVILFEGEHNTTAPDLDRRVILVYTFTQTN